MSLRAQFEGMLRPARISKFVEITVPVKIIRHILGEASQTTNTMNIGPFPSWFTFYEFKLALWNLMGRDPSFAPPLVFIGTPVGNEYKPIDIAWKNLESESQGSINLLNPFELLSSPPDSRFVDSSGGQKAIGKDTRIRMTLSDIFQLSETATNTIPELHVFLYADIIDRIPGARPLGERDIYGRILPYFPFLDITKLPSSATIKSVVTPILESQAKQTEVNLAQLTTLEGLLNSITIPTLEGIKLLRWYWYKKPDTWEGVAVLFFGLKATQDRPFLRFFPVSNQPLTKIKVKGLLAIPDLPDPNLLLTWKQDKNPESGKESVYMKIKIQESEMVDETPIYSTMRVFEDGTADLVIQPPKKTRLLDPSSDLQDAPELLDRSFSDTPFNGLIPRLAQAAVVFKLRIKREDTRVTKTAVQNRLKLFTSVFQEIPPLPDEQPLVMLRFKGVSNFTNETRVFAFLTQIAENDMISGERNEMAWVTRVSDEFQITLDEARKQVEAWIKQRGEFALAVSDTKDYILNKNPGVDIAIHEQHPSYTFHIYSDQDSKTYSTIVNLLGILITAPASAFVTKVAKTVMQVAAVASPASAESPSPAESDEGEFDEDDVPEFMRATASQRIGGAGSMAAVAAPTAADAIPEEEEEEVAFNEDEVPEFMKAATATGAATAAAAEEEEEENAVFGDDEDLPAFMKAVPTVAKPTTVPKAAAAAAAAPVTVAELKEDKEAAKAFEKPKDLSSIQLGKYYIDRLKLADPGIFVYKTQNSSERGYVSHCAANESRQPIVLDKDEYKEMTEIYKDDADLEFVLYPQTTESAHFKKRQPKGAENEAGTLDGKPYPSQDNKEVITVVMYGSKARKLHYYFCPRLFCIRDRLMIRTKDYISDKNRFAAGADKANPATWPAKAKGSCPFCGGTMLSKDDIKDKKRDPNKSILERKTRPGSDSERSIYVGFLDKKTPSGLSLPCCYASTENRFDPNDPEFVRLGLKAKAAAAPTAAILDIVPLQKGGPAEAQPIADAIQAPLGQPTVKATVRALPTAAVKGSTSTSAVKYDYYRVINGVSVRSIVDSTRLPLRIVEPREADDPKAGPQIGFLPDALDKYFKQDSTSDKFAERLEIVSKVKPAAQGFMRVAIDNSKKEQGFLSAIAPYFFLPNSEAVMETMFEPIEIRIKPKTFIQINSGNLVHEFFNKCDKKNTNDMRQWASKYLGIGELKYTNIPAIERIMNSYECFINYMRDPSQRKTLRVLSDIMSEPNIFPPRGIIFLVLEMNVEEISIRTGDKVEYRTEVKLDRVRCPHYPLNEGQQKADIAFIAHYNRITRDRYTQEKSSRDMGWDALFYIDGTQGVPESRHKPQIVFQRSQEPQWPKIVKERVSDFFNSCLTIPRGPFTSEFGIDPYALIGAQEIITAVRQQPEGMIRDAYNHLVGVAYKVRGSNRSSKGIVGIPIADDGSFSFEKNIFFDWDDFDPPPINKVIDFYETNIVPIFPQYNGYKPVGQVRRIDSDAIVGMRLDNGFVIPATDADDPSTVGTYNTEYPIEKDRIAHLDYTVNKTIAYDNEFRRRAFLHADENKEEGDETIKDREADKTFLKFNMESSQDEIEDIYQHLRLTFSTWLDTGAGSQKRERLTEILKTKEMTLNEKRRRLDILLYADVIKWLEPSDSKEKSAIGFLRIDCQIQGRETCSGRCKWVPKDTDDESCGPCKIHSPRSDGITMNVPRMLYLRLMDELIRYAAKREEIFTKQVPRLTIRREKQHQGDQLIIAEGTTDWNTWWEMLRAEWFAPEKEMSKFFDEQYQPMPTGLPSTDTRTLPASLIEALGRDDPKVSNLVWNPSTTPDRPFSFLKSIVRFNPVASKPEDTLNKDELDEIKELGNVQILYMPGGTLQMSSRVKKMGAIDALIIAKVDGTVGWISPKDFYGLKVPLSALPDSLNSFRTV